ncbi:hypothetical protein B0H14DRAFT_486105 [Mycena olivaceomarginata]|nr:hypothetical protein B0H14DRAFT_486105 [Mycena olivaceomarginata]
MHRARDCGVPLAAPRRPGAGRRRRDVAVPCDDYFYDFSLSPLFFSTRANSFTTHSRKRHRRPRRMLSHFPPADHSHPAAVHFHHQAGTFQLERQGPPAQAAGFGTTGTEILFSPRLTPVAHISLYCFLYILSSRYLSSRILHPIYTSPARTLNICVPVPNDSFPSLVACTSLQSSSRPFVSYPKYLAHWRTSNEVSSSVFKHNDILHRGLGKPDLSGLLGEHMSYIYTLAF